MDFSENTSRKFVTELMLWNQEINKRQMPWKGEKDPYKIWLSEIILQQTRVEQGLKYYERFIHSFPDIHELARAPEQEVFKHWEGLGYYSRCRNLIETAKHLAEHNNGVFPADYASILKLKGIGAYTAAAIASFAYNLPYAVLDGNVFRVLARIFAIETPIDSTEGKKLFSDLAQQLLPKAKAAVYNQAIMDFGAVICKPYPECAQCFFTDSCKAFLAGKQQLLPLKTKSLTVKERWFSYLVLKYRGKVAIRQRIEKDIWQHLFEFPLIETSKPALVKEVLLQAEKSFGFKVKKAGMGKPFAFRQRLSHQLIHFSFLVLDIDDVPSGNQRFNWVPQQELKNFPFPKTLQNFLPKIG